MRNAHRCHINISTSCIISGGGGGGTGVIKATDCRVRDCCFGSCNETL